MRLRETSSWSNASHCCLRIYLPAKADGWVGELGFANGVARPDFTNTNSDSSTDFHGHITTEPFHPFHPRGPLQSHGSNHHALWDGWKLFAIELAISKIYQIFIIVRLTAWILNELHWPTSFANYL